MKLTRICNYTVNAACDIRKCYARHFNNSLALSDVRREYLTRITLVIRHRQDAVLLFAVNVVTPAKYQWRSLDFFQFKFTVHREYIY
jgi:hypothetical protein